MKIVRVTDHIDKDCQDLSIAFSYFTRVCIYYDIYTCVYIYGVYIYPILQICESRVVYIGLGCQIIVSVYFFYNVHLLQLHSFKHIQLFVVIIIIRLFLNH